MVRVSECKGFVAKVYESGFCIQKTEMFVSENKYMVSKFSF